MPEYPEEILDEYEDDGTMVNSKNLLAEAVVGHKIVSVDRVADTDPYSYGRDKTVITLDNGKRVELSGSGDCCASTELRSFLLNPELVDHVILGVGTTDGYNTWHIYADMGDVLKLTVDWTCGNPFWYSYGFNIQVKDIDE